MSIYSGFSTRKLEYDYNICIDHILSLLSMRSIKHIQGERVDEDKFKKIYKKQFKSLQKMEAHKYLYPKFSETLIPLARVLNLKIMDPIRISMQKDSKTDLKDNTIQLTTISNAATNNSYNTISNTQLSNSKSRCYSAVRGAQTINSYQRPMSMEMRNRRENINKKIINRLDQQGVIQIKDTSKNENQHQILNNNPIKTNKDEQDQQTLSNNQNQTNQNIFTTQNPKQKKSITISEERNIIDLQKCEMTQKDNENKTLLQSKKPGTFVNQEKENIENKTKKQQYQEKNKNLCEMQMKIIEKQRSVTPSAQGYQENTFFVKQKQNDRFKNKQEEQITNENNDKSIRTNKGRVIKQNKDNLQLRRKSQTQEIPHNLNIEINFENIPNTCTSYNTNNGGQLTQKNQFGFVNSILKKSSKYIGDNPKIPLSSRYRKQKEPDQSKNLHIEQSPQKRDNGYNSFYVETSSIKNLNQNNIQQQQKQDNIQKNTNNHVNNEMPQGILQEIQNLNTSMNKNQNQTQFNSNFNDINKKQDTSKNKTNLSSTIGIQINSNLRNKSTSNQRSKNASLKQINQNNNSKDQSQHLPSQKVSRGISIDYDSSFKEFLLNTQKQDQSETQFRNKMMAQNLNVIQNEINNQQSQSKSQTLLTQKQLEKKGSISNENKLSNPLCKVNLTEYQEPLKSYQNQLLPLYSVTSKHPSSYQSPRFDSDTFGFADNQLSLTPIKQIIKRKKSKRKKSQNDKTLSHSFGINTPKMSQIYSQKYNSNFSPQSYNNEIK